MTIYTLKETLHDRIRILEAGLDQMTSGPGVVSGVRGERYEAHVLEGRLEEARVIFHLVDQVAKDQVTWADDPDRYDPGRC